MTSADARSVERWRSGDERPEVLMHTLVWHPRADLVPLEIVVRALIEEALG